MIVDTLGNSAVYEHTHPLFRAAFNFLRRPESAKLTEGRIALQEDRLFALVQGVDTKPVPEGRLEAHRKYIDIQYVVEGVEYMGYTPLQGLDCVQPYNASDDIAFYKGSSSLVKISRGMFAVFYPQDAHLPCRCLGESGSRVKKIVLKVLVSA